MNITITWHNSNPETIWNKLAVKLGREPTNVEATEEVKRILNEASDVRLQDKAAKGSLPWQRR